MLRQLRSAATAAIIISAAVLTGCGDDGITLPDERAAAAIDISAGDAQEATVGTALPQPVRALVTDAQGSPVANQRVDFAASGGGTADPASAQTDANGVASTEWTLGTTSGAQTLTARPVGNGAASVSATATATATAGPAATMAAVSGSPQSAVAGTSLANPLIVQVEDQFGNGVPGVQVDWTVTGGGSVSDPTAETDAEGLSSVIRTLGPATGAQSTQAAVDGLEGSPVTFAATATSGSAGNLVKIAGDGQEAPVNTVLPIDPRVRVTDALGNPVSGATVTFSVLSGGGTVTGATPTTNTNGEAAVGSWRLGTTPGTNTLTATAPGTVAVTFTATAEAGTGSGLEFNVAPPTTIASGAILAPAPVVQIVDAQGNPVAASGIPITISISSGGSLGGGALTRNTDANGRVSFVGVTASGAVGSYTLSFSGQGTPLTSPLSITAGAVSAAQSSLVLTPATISAGGNTTVTVTARDAAGNPIANASVALSAAPGPDDFGDASLTTAGDGEASTTFSAAATGTQTISATITGPIGGPVVESADLTVQAAATTTNIGSHNPSPSIRGDPVTVTFAVTATSGTPTGQVNVTTNEGASCSGSTAAGQCVLTFTTAGTWTITATYQGGGAFSGSSDTEQHVVDPAPSDLTITGFSVEPATVGQNVTVQYSVTSSVGTPDGDVSITTSGPDDAPAPGDSCVGTVAEGGCDVAFAAAGDWIVTATYAGSVGYSGDEAARSLSVLEPPGAGSASTIEVRRQPSSEVRSGERFARQPEIRVRDGSGNNVAGMPVSVALHSGTGVLGGRLTDVTRANGVGSWDDLRITGTGSHVLRFSAGQVYALSAPISVAP